MMPFLVAMQHPALAFAPQLYMQSLFTLLDNSFQNSTEVRVALIHTLGLQIKVPVRNIASKFKALYILTAIARLQM